MENANECSDALVKMEVSEEFKKDSGLAAQKLNTGINFKRDKFYKNRVKRALGILRRKKKSHTKLVKRNLKQNRFIGVIENNNNPEIANENVQLYPNEEFLIILSSDEEDEMANDNKKQVGEVEEDADEEIIYFDNYKFLKVKRACAKHAEKKVEKTTDHKERVVNSLALDLLMEHFRQSRSGKNTEQNSEGKFKDISNVYVQIKEEMNEFSKEPNKMSIKKSYLAKLDISDISENVIETASGSPGTSQAAEKSSLPFLLEQGSPSLRFLAQEEDQITKRYLPKPTVRDSYNNAELILTWTHDNNITARISSYELFIIAQEIPENCTPYFYEKLADVKALSLPMSVTLKFKEHPFVGFYHIIVRCCIEGQTGPFSDPVCALFMNNQIEGGLEAINLSPTPEILQEGSGHSE